MKTFFSISILFMLNLGNAQLVETSVYNEKVITIGSFANGTNSHASIQSEIIDGTLYYTLNYGLLQSQSQKNTFKESDNILEELYTLLHSFFLKENKRNEKYQKTFKLGDEDVICTLWQGIPTTIYFRTNNGEFYLSEKQLNKLFGKKI